MDIKRVLSGIVSGTIVFAILFLVVIVNYKKSDKELYKIMDNISASSLTNIEEVYESNIKCPYTEEDAIEDNVYTYDGEDNIYKNKSIYKEFMNKVENREVAYLRYANYNSGFLSDLRDIVYDGNEFILIDYDTTNPEDEYYHYVIRKDDEIYLDGDNYRLKKSEDTLFPIG